MNTKGFTLIELLAVIVILAIILLIAMPIVLDVINEAREGAFNATGHGLVKSAENDYYRRSLDTDATLETVTYSFDGGEQQEPVPDTVAELDFSGEAPEEGEIIVASNGDIYMAINDGTFCTYKAYDSTDVETDVMDDMEEECEIDALDLAPVE